MRYLSRQYWTWTPFLLNRPWRKPSLSLKKSYTIELCPPAFLNFSHPKLLRSKSDQRAYPDWSGKHSRTPGRIQRRRPITILSVFDRVLCTVIQCIDGTQSLSHNSTVPQMVDPATALERLSGFADGTLPIIFITQSSAQGIDDPIIERLLKSTTDLVKGWRQLKSWLLASSPHSYFKSRKAYGNNKCRRYQGNMSGNCQDLLYCQGHSGIGAWE